MNPPVLLDNFHGIKYNIVGKVYQETEKRIWEKMKKDIICLPFVPFLVLICIYQNKGISYRRIKEMKKVMERIKSLNVNENRVCATVLAAGAVIIMTGLSAQAADFSNVVNPVVSLINSFLKPMLALVAAVGTLYCVLLGVNFARAEEPQEREKAKTHLKNAIIGFVLIFVLIVVMNLSMAPLQEWVNSSTNGAVNVK